MSRRWLSLWLPDWSIERLMLACRRQGETLPVEQPLALVAADRGGRRLTALTAAARALGLRPGMSLSDARAIHPALLVREAEPGQDAAALLRLALWCQRWSPRVAVDGADGIALDLTGCCHLWGGEAGMLDDLRRAFDRLSLTVRPAIADRLLVAWAWARLTEGGIVPDGGTAVLDAFDIAALRLDGATIAALRRLGLRRVGQLRPLPRASLLRRFGTLLVQRLDELEGVVEPPFTPLREPAQFAVRAAWPEPIGRTESIAAALQRLLAELCRALERAQTGARRLRLGLARVDGATAWLEARASRPSCAPDHLFRLLAPRLDGVDIGFGIELMLIEAVEVAALAPTQTAPAAIGGNSGDDADGIELARLVDRLASRLGPAAVRRPTLIESHIPERAVRWRSATRPVSLPLQPALLVPRPLRLLRAPQAITAIAPVPDGPPVRIGRGRQMQRVAAATGPERLLPEWWRPEDEAARLRDYYRLLLDDGTSLWVYRAGGYDEAVPPTWWLHGRFG